MNDRLLSRSFWSDYSDQGGRVRHQTRAAFAVGLRQRAGRESGAKPLKGKISLFFGLDDFYLRSGHRYFAGKIGLKPCQKRVCGDL
jgi:hypothetical protein